MPLKTYLRVCPRCRLPLIEDAVKDVIRCETHGVQRSWVVVSGARLVGAGRQVLGRDVVTTPKAVWLAPSCGFLRVTHVAELL